MTELERRLLALGRELDVPSAPDLSSTVQMRLERRPRRPFPWRRAALLAAALLAIAIGAAFAVPQARTALLRWLHLRGATIERVETLPPAVERSQAGGLGRSLSREEAERQVGFRLALPPFKGDGPRRVYVLDDSVATVILHAYGRPILLSQFQSADGSLLKKLAAGKTVVDPVQVAGRPGLWLEGAPHTLTYFDRSLGFQERTVLIHGNVLVWVRGELTLRLEGKLSRAQALRIARTIR
jgi:hypothetical protein